MRRSILIVMLDVMVLSVLALTAGKRGGGSEAGIPVPMYRWSAMIEEGLRQEQSLTDQVQTLEAQLAEASEIAKRALEQASKSQLAADQAREGSSEMQTRLMQATLDIERSRSKAERAEIEAELAARQAAEAELRSLQMEKRAQVMEQREAEAQARAAASVAQARDAETAAMLAERKALAALSEREVLKQQIQAVSESKRSVEESAEESALRLKEMEARLVQQNQVLAVAQGEVQAAKERAASAVAERERLLTRSEETTENLAQLREQVAALEVQKENESAKVVELESQQQEAAEEAAKSIWVQRDEALRQLKVSYTEYSKRNDRSYTTHRQLAMPKVRIGRTVVIPAEFGKLGLAPSFFKGLSDSVTDVSGTLTSVAADGAPAQSIRSIVVPKQEPQVCFVAFDGDKGGAIASITMEVLKERRLAQALLFSPEEVNENGRVAIVPVVGSDYLKVRAEGGKKPKVGDYLMSERGEFIGIMVTKEDCYVTPKSLQNAKEAIPIPMTRNVERQLYFSDFIHALKAARYRVKEHLKQRML